jgi:hypothetical protein
LPAVLSGLALLALLAAGTPARAQGNLRTELAEVAKSIKKVLDGRNETAVAVGQFTGPPSFPSSAGPAIARELGEELRKEKVDVKLRANLVVEGRYKDATDKETGLLAAQLNVKVLDRRDEVLVEFQRGIFGDATLASLFGLTTQLPSDGDAKTRNKKLEEALDNPHSAITATRIAAAGSPYAVEVLVKKAGDPAAVRARAAEDREGLAFVPIRRGEVYEVRLINDAGHEAAVSLTIDGLSMFTFSDLKNPHTGQPAYAVVFVGPHRSVTIKGWHRTNEYSEEFLVTEYSRSAAAELKSTANIGTITACFSAAWPTSAKPPADEPANPNEHARGADATGRGAQVQARYVEVARHIGVVRAAVSVRYTK